MRYEIGITPPSPMYARHMYGYVNNNDYFTIQLFPEGHKDDLQLLGSTSGRDGDKAAKTKLTPIACEHGVTFAEASLTLACKKLYRQPMEIELMPQDMAKQFLRVSARTQVPHRRNRGRDWVRGQV